MLDITGSCGDDPVHACVYGVRLAGSRSVIQFYCSCLFSAIHGKVARHATRQGYVGTVAAIEAQLNDFSVLELLEASRDVRINRTSLTASRGYQDGIPRELYIRSAGSGGERV